MDIQKAKANIAKRNRAEKRFRLYGLMAVSLAAIFLFFLLTSIVSRGYTAFQETRIQLTINLDAAQIDPNATGRLEDYDLSGIRPLIYQALKDRFPGVEGRTETRMLYQLVSSNAEQAVIKIIQASPELVGHNHAFWLRAASDIDMAEKGRINREKEEAYRRVKDIQFGWIDDLRASGQIDTFFNTTFFTNADSRNPEDAGVLGSLIGSFWTVLTCMLIAFPLAVSTAVYLEEFAPKNKWTDLIEININNLAAVPSIIFGLLGLAVFLNFFGLPRSAALVGGMTLSLMILPTIVITTRNALKAVPPSIRDGALAIGASPMQVVMHHTLPLAMPGIMTGSILGVARALGETAPLLMIGMVAFVADIPGSVMSSSTSLPVQIYLWADSPEMGFAEKTSAAIMVLLAFLISANLLAVWLRKKYERKW